MEGKLRKGEIIKCDVQVFFFSKFSINDFLQSLFSYFKITREAMKKKHS